MGGTKAKLSTAVDRNDFIGSVCHLGTGKSLSLQGATSCTRTCPTFGQVPSCLRVSPGAARTGRPAQFRVDRVVYLYIKSAVT